MTTPVSGISLNAVQTEFGGSNPIGVNEYYKADVGVPASGVITLNDLRGKTRHATKTEIATFFASPGGVYRRTSENTASNSPVVGESSMTAGADLLSETYLFTPNTITSGVAANLKNCVENTVVWFFGGDNAADTSAITAHQINGNGVTITPTYNTRAASTAPTPDGYAVCQFSVYNTALTPAVGTSGRLTAITQASCTFPALGGRNQQIGGAFLLPGKWTAVVPYAGFVSSGDSVTLNHGDICLVGWASNNDPQPGSVPFNVTVNLPLSNAAGNILPNFVFAKRWYGCTGVLFYANLSGATRTYTLPSSLQFGNPHTIYKHYMILKFAPDQYYGQQS